jgi:hypothetical protein
LKKRTIINIATATNIKIRTIIATITAFISFYTINHVALYIIKKATNRKTILKKNKKSLKLNLGLPTEINLVILTTNLINNSINILWTIRIMILT